MCLAEGGKPNNVLGEGKQCRPIVVIIAIEGMSMHLILWSDEHRQNILMQVILCTTRGIRRERRKVVIKSIGHYRKYTRVIRIFTCRPYNGLDSSSGEWSN